jgi:hypothetical protein
VKTTKTRKVNKARAEEFAAKAGKYQCDFSLLALPKFFKYFLIIMGKT